jgi:RNA polymerase sigma-70 factor (ECF subfamily)
MLTVWRRAAQFDRNKAAVSTWVFTIARNRRIDTLRRARRPEIDPEDPALVREPDDPADRVVEAAQRRESLHAAVAELPEDQAKLLRLAYFEDKSHSVIAEELALPLGTVKSRLRLAMGKLRAALETME